MKGKFITTQIWITCLASQRIKETASVDNNKTAVKADGLSGDDQNGVILSSAEEFGQVA